MFAHLGASFPRTRTTGVLSPLTNLLQFPHTKPTFAHTTKDSMAAAATSSLSCSEGVDAPAARRRFPGDFPELKDWNNPQRDENTIAAAAAIQAAANSLRSVDLTSAIARRQNIILLYAPETAEARMSPEAMTPLDSLDRPRYRTDQGIQELTAAIKLCPHLQELVWRCTL